MDFDLEKTIVFHLPGLRNGQTMTLAISRLFGDHPFRKIKKPSSNHLLLLHGKKKCVALGVLLVSALVNAFIVSFSNYNLTVAGLQLKFYRGFRHALAAGQNLLLQISNPAGSGKTMFVSRVSGGISIAGATIAILKNGTVTGTTVTPVNLNFGSSNTSVMAAKSATGTVTGSPVTVISLIFCFIWWEV
ncbi:hypothetical protein ACFQI7_02185 [Paenibacillus allorhizosphaerae]|nr:hypothetical protein [Paenibacillus allorhizosphaerae]